MPNHRIRSDDFDIESGKRYGDRDRRRSRSPSRMRRRAVRNCSRSKSRSIERRGRKHERVSYSRSRSRSRGGSSKQRDRRRRYHDRSRSRSRSYSQSYGRSARKHTRRDESRERRSCSRNSSQYGDDDRNRHNKDREEVQCRKSQKSESVVSPNKFHNKRNYTNDALSELPLPGSYNDSSNDSDDSYEHAQKSYYDFHSDEPIDKERIHREIEEKLRMTLAKEGKVYPPPKTEASHPVFANDGSFLEIFKKMQEQQQATTSNAASAAPAVPVLAVASPTTAPYLVATAMGKSAPPPPIVGRRRGGKILKTGVVAKPKVQNETASDPKDFWSLYLAEVNKYKNTACESEAGNRPLVK